MDSIIFYGSLIVSMILAVGFLFCSFFLIPQIPAKKDNIKAAGSTFFFSSGLMYLYASLFSLREEHAHSFDINSYLIMILVTIQLISGILFIVGLRGEFGHLKTVIELNEEVTDALEEVEILKSDVITKR